MKNRKGKRHTAEQIIRKLREADTMLAAGKTIGQVVQVLEEQCGMLVEIPDSANYAIAYPLFIDESLHGVVALEVAFATESQLQKAMEQVQWGVAWLELLVRRRQADIDQATLKRLTAAVDLLAVTLSEERFSAAAMVLTTELAEASNCERVSLGFMRNGHLKLQAVSHSAEVGKKMNLTRAIEQVMEDDDVKVLTY